MYQGTENQIAEVSSINNRKIKILFVLRMLGYGGAERQVVELCEGMNKNAFDITVVLFYYDEGFLSELKQTGVTIHILATKSTYKRTTLFRLIRLMRQERFDIVHTFLPIANFVGGLAARLSGRPYVIGSLRVANPFSLRDPFCLMDFFAFHGLCNHIVVNSETGKRCTMVDYRVPEQRIDVIYNGKNLLDLQVQREGILLRQDFAIPEDHFVVTNVARINKQKGQQYLVEAARYLIRDKNVNNLTVLIVGKPEDNFEAVQKIITDNRLEGHIRLLGIRHDVPDILRISDAFVFPSLWEGLPNALLEAMIVQVPVIATRIGPNEEIIEHDKTGILVEPHDPMALADGISALMHDRNRAERLAGAGYEDVLGRFGLERLVHEHENLYEKIYQEHMALQ